MPYQFRYDVIRFQTTVPISIQRIMLKLFDYRINDELYYFEPINRSYDGTNYKQKYLNNSINATTQAHNS